MKRKLFPILSVLACALLAALCGCGKNTEKPIEKQLPLVKTEAQTYFTFDLYGTAARVLELSDYIDENGLAVTYTVTAPSADIVTVTEPAEGAFSITATAVGKETVTLEAAAEDGSVTVKIVCNVINTAPDKPVIEREVYEYDKAAAGDAQIPVTIGNGLPSLLKVNGKRLQERYWQYDEKTKCVCITEAYAGEMQKGDYAIEFITTGGSAKTTLRIVNSVTTSFDPVTEKSVLLTDGGDGSVSFSADFGGATVEKIVYGDYVLQAGTDYAVHEDGIEIKEAFYSHTCEQSTAAYRVYLSNHDAYDFSIHTNVLFFTDYDITTIHDDLVSNIGHNPLYQDSTRVAIVDAPEGSGMTGKVLRYEPHTTDVTYSVYGIYTLEQMSGGSTWYHVNLVHGRQYTVSFDYFAEGTQAGEDFRFRSWTGGISAPPIDTADTGEMHHFSYTFTWNSSQSGIFLYGKFKEKGYLYFDNFSLVEAREPAAAVEPDLTDYGGKIAVPFDGTFSENFAIYTENYYGEHSECFVRDGSLFCAGKVETKVMYLGKTDFTTFAVEAEFAPLEETLAMSTGFYLYARNAGPALDGITGYAIVLERNRNNGYGTLNLHRFDHSWLGSVAQQSFPIRGDTVPMRVTAADGHIRVYLYGSAVPTLEVQLPSWSAGGVGFRNFRGVGSRVTGFSITAPGYETDTSALQAAIAAADKIDTERYTAPSVDALQRALMRARAALGANAAEAEAALAELNAAADDLAERCTFAELTDLVQEARRALAGNYCANGKNSLTLAVENAEALSEGSGEEPIARAAGAIRAALDRLIAL